MPSPPVWALWWKELSATHEATAVNPYCLRMSSSVSSHKPPVQTSCRPRPGYVACQRHEEKEKHVVSGGTVAEPVVDESGKQKHHDEETCPLVDRGDIQQRTPLVDGKIHRDTESTEYETRNHRQTERDEQEQGLAFHEHGIPQVSG